MPSNIADLDAFTSPVVVPADADPANAASVVTPFQALSNRTRNVHNRTTALETAVENRLGGVATGAGEWLYPSARTRTLVVSPYNAIGFMRGGAVAEPPWIIEAGTPADGVRNRVSEAILQLPVSDLVPEGAVVDRVRALVKPASVATMSMNVHELSMSFGTPAYALVGSATAAVSSGTAVQVLSVTGSWTVTKATRQLHARLTASTAILCDVYAFEIRFTDPGPRNY